VKKIILLKFVMYPFLKCISPILHTVTSLSHADQPIVVSYRVYLLLTENYLLDTNARVAMPYWLSRKALGSLPTNYHFNNIANLLVGIPRMINFSV
jgi:hypothetical protein